MVKNLFKRTNARRISAEKKTENNLFPLLCRQQRRGEKIYNVYIIVIKQKHNATKTNLVLF